VLSHVGEGNVAWIYYLGSYRSYVFACSPQTGVHAIPLSVSADEADTLGLPFDEAMNSADAVRPLCVEDAVSLVKRAVFSMASEAASNDRGSRRTVVQATKYRQEDVARATEVLVPRMLRDYLVAESARHLLIVPDGALHQLPFEALPTSAEGSEFLLDVLPPTTYAPSLEIYDQLADEDSRAGEQVSVLSVASPNYGVGRNADREPASDKLSSFGVEFFAQGGSLPQLPATKQESDAVCQAFGTSLTDRARIVPLTGDVATEANVRRELTARGFSYLHFAVHGLVDQKYQNLFGALALSTPAKPSPVDDGFLSLNEIMNLPGLDRCELAVLSACETNCGPERPLEAGSTMSRAFLCAGAQRVVCSHWTVNDVATSKLIGKFLNEVAAELAREGRVDYATDLQAAKTELRNDPATRGPYFWASFVLIGPPTGGESAVGPAVATTRD
jgi:CHAT domain-containing protein